MKHITLRISIAALALACAGCNLTGPSESLTGDWTASTGVTSFVGMTLHQDGDDISGTACSRSDGVLLYHGVPVRGDHPDVAFEVTSRYTQPCCAHLAGVRFSGELDGTHGIVGRLNDVEIRFERSGSRACP